MKNNIPKKAVILAGGKGTRLYPLTRKIPKPLLPVNKKPIINHLVDLFNSQGVNDIAVLINKNHRKNFSNWQRKYYQRKNPKIKLFEEKKPLGTFGGFFLLKNWLRDNPFFVSNGDELKRVNLKKLAEFHQNNDCIGTIALVKVDNPKEYGVTICEGKKIKKFIEKPKNPPSNYISSGLYLLSPEIFNYHQGPKFTMIENDVFPRLVKEKKLAGFKFKGNWMDTGTWERYAKAIKDWE